ncbi:hypothetical protein L596_005922 [Steinernema carpocapsae]|uniref:Uncharacterized protein n=1 Tax=Steinernema carpocapsae TaxID=34508 RepID=A0A4U8V5C7_STECR|nr:hypothetical protein L596_005922 [Steinernema carpocapsae]
MFPSFPKRDERVAAVELSPSCGPRLLTLHASSPFRVLVFEPSRMLSAFSSRMQPKDYPFLRLAKRVSGAVVWPFRQCPLLHRLPLPPNCINTTYMCEIDFAAHNLSRRRSMQSSLAH